MLLQDGTLPLSPDGAFDYSIEHRCASVLIWPEDEKPSVGNTVITDPCMTSRGFRDASRRLERRGMSFRDIGVFFMTHGHGDHQLNLSYFLGQTALREFRTPAGGPLSGIISFPHPGHSQDSEALIFRSSSNQRVCIAGDAVLDPRWLKAWAYFWPNNYIASQIVQTWESVAGILSYADCIIPGHGEPITVTTSLVEELLSTFASARYAGECKNVKRLLNNRLKQLAGNL